MTRSEFAMRALLADDHNLFRAGLAELLNSSETIDVVGQASSGHEALALAAQLKPHVLLLDASMPGPGPVRLIQRLATEQPAVSVIMLTMHDDPQLVADTLQAGARGYLLKSAQRDQLLAALHLAARPDDEVTIQVSRTTALALTRGPAQTAISPRESQVLVALDQAKSNRKIAAELHISDATVKRHLTNLYNKLNVTTRAEALRKARATGLLPKAYGWIDD